MNLMICQIIGKNGERSSKKKGKTPRKRIESSSDEDENSEEDEEENEPEEDEELAEQTQQIKEMEKKSAGNNETQSKEKDDFVVPVAPANRPKRSTRTSSR